jgi:MOSC domain-containing protein YiiM
MPIQARGTVSAIHVKAEQGAKPSAVTRVMAIAGKGLEGDRFAAIEQLKKPEYQVTLIEEEAVNAIHAEQGLKLDPGESRRNITTRNIALNHLVGKEFRIGKARFRGIRLCEPCGYLEKVTGKPLRELLLHRGGLRAIVLEGGEISVGDSIEALAAARPDQPIIGG